MVSQKLIAASYEPLVLSLLEYEQSYGYDLIQRIGELSDESIRWTPGKLYPLLHRMEADGLLDAEWITAESGRDRKYYAITDLGRRALMSARREWLDVHQVMVRLWGKGSQLQSMPG